MGTKLKKKGFFKTKWVEYLKSKDPRHPRLKNYLANVWVGPELVMNIQPIILLFQ